MSSVSRPAVRANCTLVRWGNTGWRSSSGPTRLASPSSRRSTKTTQWGLPTDTTVAVTLPPSGSTSGTATVSRSGPVIGIAEERKLAVPISTVTKFTRPSRSWHVHSTTPPVAAAAVLHRRRRRAAGRRARGQRVAGAALPDQDVERVASGRARELHVGALGKHGMALEQRADAPGLALVETVHEVDAVGVAHGHDRRRDLAAVRQHERHRHRLAVGAGHRNRRGAEARRAHLDGDEVHAAVPLVARALHHAARGGSGRSSPPPTPRRRTTSPRPACSRRRAPRSGCRACRVRPCARTARWCAGETRDGARAAGRRAWPRPRRDGPRSRRSGGCPRTRPSP